MFRRCLAVSFLLSVAALAHADVITLTQTGTVGFPVSGVYTTDTYGYFGTPGGDLAGEAFSLTATYDTQYFTPIPCGTGCTAYVASSPNAATLELTINGVTQVPNLNAGSNLTFEGSASGASPYFEEVIGTVGVGFVGTQDPAYWVPLTGLSSIDFANIGFGTLQSETVALNVVTSMSTIMPSPAAVPEPGTFALVLTGVAAAGSKVAKRWRR